jgi:PmbA protein
MDKITIQKNTAQNSQNKKDIKDIRENEKELTAIVDHVLKEAQKLGATSAEAGIAIESGLSTTVRLGSVETIEFNHDKSLGLTVYFGKRKGSISSTDFRPEALQTVVAAACNIAKYSEEDPAAGLAEKEMLAKEIPNLDLYYPWNISPEQAIQYAKECEDAARSFDSRISNSEGASLSSHAKFRVYANSHGFIGAYPSSSHGMSCSVIAQAASMMQRDQDYTISRDPKHLENFAKVGKKAAERTLSRLSARKIKTTQAPVLIDSTIAAGFIGNFIAAISGGNLYRKSTFLVDSLGKQIFPDFVQMEEMPHLMGGLGSAPFDLEGVATRQHHIIKDGILESYVLGSYSARKLGLKTTGNAGGIHNLKVSHSGLNRDALIKKMDRGLIVTEMMGHGINLVTGDYSRGAAGFWVENGEIQYPVEEITIAGNLKDMFLRLLHIGSDTEKRSNIQTGSLLIEQMTIAGS